MPLTNDDVVRRWADYNEGGAYSTRKPAGRSKSIRYEGPVLYSYQTGIARYYKDFVLLTSHKWGVTTAHHLTLALRAISCDYYHVPFLADEHDANADYLHHLLNENVEQAVRSYRSRSNADDGMPKYTRDNIAYDHGQVVSYVKRTKAKLRNKLRPLDELLADVVRRREEKWGKFMDPKEVLKRERAKARNMAKLALIGEL